MQLITFHPEASTDIDQSINLIKDGGCKAGLVLNPDIPIDVLEGYLEKLDMILLMSVFRFWRTKNLLIQC